MTSNEYRTALAALGLHKGQWCPVEKTMTSDELLIVLYALRAAEAEIHNPGAARASGIDLLNLIEQAELIVRTEAHTAN